MRYLLTLTLAYILAYLMIAFCAWNLWTPQEAINYLSSTTVSDRGELLAIAAVTNLIIVAWVRTHK